jgi:predicted dehydrogenase
VVALGLVGVGAMWERRYRPVLSRLADRLAIRAVYDPVPARAELAAAELQADVAAGLHQLFERADLHGVLILDPAWQGLVPAWIACECRRPAFLAGSLGEELPLLRELHACSQRAGTLLMTEFSRRHTPATNRLRELMVTHLGPTRRITVETTIPVADVPDNSTPPRFVTEFLVGLLDWCAYVAGRIPVKLLAEPIAPSSAGAAGWQVKLDFRPDVQGTPSAVLQLRLPSSSDQSEIPVPFFAVDCERGRATLASSTEIAWENSAAARQESLTSDRSEAEVMLDKFCRRVLGGLVPAADVLDACRSIALARAAEISLSSGQSVTGLWDAT